MKEKFWDRLFSCISSHYKTGSAIIHFWVLSPLQVYSVPLCVQPDCDISSWHECTWNCCGLVAPLFVWLDIDYVPWLCRFLSTSFAFSILISKPKHLFFEVARLIVAKNTNRKDQRRAKCVISLQENGYLLAAEATVKIGFCSLENRGLV